MANIGVIARSPEVYPWLVATLTAKLVKQYFTGICHGEVTRHEVPNLSALNFLLDESLGGGGTVSLRLDAQGKTMSHALLAMEVTVPRALLEAAQRGDDAYRAEHGLPAKSRMILHATRAEVISKRASVTPTPVTEQGPGRAKPGARPKRAVAEQPEAAAKAKRVARAKVRPMPKPVARPKPKPVAKPKPKPVARPKPKPVAKAKPGRAPKRKPVSKPAKSRGKQARKR